MKRMRDLVRVSRPCAWVGPLLLLSGACSRPSPPGPSEGSTTASVASVSAPPPVALPPSASELGASASARLPDADEVVGAARAKMRSCYDAGLRRNRSLSGRVVVSALVSAAGTVTEATLASVQGLDGPTNECLLGVVRAMVFAPREGGKPTLVNIPISFVQVGPEAGAR